MSTASTERRRWLDRKENVDKVYWGVWLLCALLLAIEPWVHKHGDFAFERWFGFHGWYGFVAYTISSPRFRPAFQKIDIFTGLNPEPQSQREGGRPPGLTTRRAHATPCRHPGLPSPHRSPGSSTG